MKIKYFSWIKEITKIEIEQINDKSINDINSLKILISTKYPKLKKYLKKNNVIRIAVNLEHVSKNKRIFSDDEIAFFPPVSGG